MSSGKDDPKDLSKGWAWTTLGAIAEIKSGLTKGKKRRSTARPVAVPYLRVENVHRGYLDLTDVAEIMATPEEIDQSALRAGDILFNEGGDRNRLGGGWVWSDELNPCIHHNQVFRARLASSDISPWLISYYGNSSPAQDYFLRTGKQTPNRASINRTNLSQLPIPLPPAGEQRRIAAKLEALQHRTRRARTALDAIPPLLEKFRQSVLAAAFSGDLTADWRARNPDVEPAVALLERIREERRRRWEEAELATMAAKGKVPKDDRWKEKYTEPPILDTKELPTVPATWSWSRLDVLAAIKGGLAKEKRRRTPDCLRSVPYLRVANVQHGFLDLKEMLLTEATPDEISDLQLAPGDILFSEGGDRDKLGCGWIWEGQIPECIHQNQVFRARLFSNEINPHVVSHYVNSHGQAHFTDDGKPTTNIASISLSKLSALPVPIMPEAEAKILLGRLSSRLLGADHLSRRLSDSFSADIAKLEQAILAKAFRGDLVPQDPNDEPAAKLLERIRAEKSAPPSPRRGRRRAKPKPPVEPSPRLPCEPEPTPTAALELPQLASARDYALDDWRRALLSSLGDDPADRQDAIEAAAIWAAENMGLVYERLPKNGLIVRGLKSALRSAIRRGEVERLGASWVRLVGRGSDPLPARSTTP